MFYLHTYAKRAEYVMLCIWMEDLNTISVRSQLNIVSQTQ